MIQVDFVLNLLLCFLVKFLNTENSINSVVISDRSDCFIDDNVLGIAMMEASDGIIVLSTLSLNCLAVVSSGRGRP